MATVINRFDVAWAEALPELDDQQVGAIRRIINLSRQLRGDWSGMLGPDTFGEDFGAFRFQLAYMSYALALAHVHRLPAAPGLFQKPFEDLIEKILSPDCWIYWSHVSTGDASFNKSLGKLPQRFDPVAEDNIMYSAYVQSMALMYHYIFRSDKYAQPDALTFRLKTKFWAEGGFTFPYDERSLNEVIYWQMSEQGFLGVACEPNCIFQICNQPNLIGFRMHDMIYGGDLAEQASRGYVQAWQEFGMLDSSGNFNTFVLAKERVPIPIDAPNMNFWLMTLMHSWNPELVEEQYPKLMQRCLLDGPDDTKWIEPCVPFGETPEAPRTARDMSWAACCASEVGDTQTLSSLLRYADRFMNGTWENGAYYYKRRDTNFDEQGNFIGMDPASGNAMYAYARLNVKDGLRKLYEGPLDDLHFSQPALVGLPADLDVRRAIFDAERNALVLTFGALAESRRIVLEVRAPAESALPTVSRDGTELTSAAIRTEAGVSVTLDHCDRATLVLQW